MFLLLDLPPSHQDHSIRDAPLAEQAESVLTTAASDKPITRDRCLGADGRRRTSSNTHQQFVDEAGAQNVLVSWVIPVLT
jgi:hypothetical protein